MYQNLLRALSSPLGYLIAGYLRPTMGDSAYLVGTTISSSLVEWVISIISSIPVDRLWKRWSAQARSHRQQLVITDPVTMTSFARWFRECYPEQVTGYQITPEGNLAVTALRLGATILLEEVPVLVSVTEQRITFDYPSHQITQRQIADAIHSWTPAHITLRNYHWNISEWRLTEDILTSTRENTFFTEQVEREFVQDVLRFIQSQPGELVGPHKRNYLLWGTAGSGKTSIVRSVLGHLRIFRISNDLLSSKSDFLRAVSSIHDQVKLGDYYVVLIDELDKFDLQYSSTTEVDVGNLCEFLDGIMPNTGRIVVITANRIRRLQDNPELLRAGRIHAQIYMDRPDDHQLRQTISYHRPEWTLPDRLVYAQSISSLISVLIDPAATLEGCLALVAAPEPSAEAGLVPVGSAEEEEEDDEPPPPTPEDLLTQLETAMAHLQLVLEHWMSHGLDRTLELGYYFNPCCRLCGMGAHSQQRSHCVVCAITAAKSIQQRICTVWPEWTEEQRDVCRARVRTPSDPILQLYQQVCH